MGMDIPELTGFNFQGGLTLSPEFIALLLGLVLYTAAFVAEAVRAGIQAVSKGQREAAMAVGLKPNQVLQ
jgi:general L-amino acid transport system permease protein